MLGAIVRAYCPKDSLSSRHDADDTELPKVTALKIEDGVEEALVELL
jgi:hypothetical protein